MFYRGRSDKVRYQSPLTSIDIMQPRDVIFPQLILFSAKIDAWLLNTFLTELVFKR